MKESKEEGIEELLKPRRKLMIKYPGCIYKVGDIFTLRGGWWFTENHEQGITDIDKYLDIFKELFWWEERREEEMPEYVSINFNVWKIIKWDYSWFNNPTAGPEHINKKSFKIEWHFYKHKSKPATPSEYNNQNNSK